MSTVGVYTREMASKKPTKKDKAWQERVEKQVKAEKLKLGHPKGKERFERAVEQISKLPKKKE